MLQERIAYYKWLSASGAFKRDPALARSGARALLGLEPGASQKGRQRSFAGRADQVLELVLRLLVVELLERSVHATPRTAPPGGGP